MCMYCMCSCRIVQVNNKVRRIMARLWLANKRIQPKEPRKYFLNEELTQKLFFVFLFLFAGDQH